MATYGIGTDYGTLSGRTVLVNVETGEEVAEAVLDEYKKLHDYFGKGDNDVMQALRCFK
ncbi:MAG: hypothetical protein IJW55_09590 [Clostridia bacterium]|nr:hypothetical protein [Clostridia bacterium]